MSKYIESDAAKDTDSSQKEVSKSWHDARDDVSERERNASKTSDKTSDSSLGSVLSKFFWGK